MLRSRLLVAYAVSFFLEVQCAGTDLAFVGGTVYASPESRPVPNALILIRKGRIAAIRPGGYTIPPSAKVIDCSGRFILAGFYNNHVHFIGPSWDSAAEAPAARLRLEIRRMLTRFGFTTVYDLSSPLENTLAVRRRIESGEIEGPAIRSTGMGYVKKDGTPSYVRGQFRLPEIDSAAEATHYINQRIDAGADAIKLFTGSAGVSGPPLQRQYVLAATSAAHRRGKLVFAHPQHRTGLENAIEGGVDILVHTTVQAEVWDEVLIARMLAKRMALIPTLKLFTYEARQDGEPPAEVERWAALTREQLRAFIRGGGQVLFGTDIGYMSDFDPTEEYDLMAKAGMTWRQILASLTTNPARRFGDARRGIVRRGWDADLTVLAEDPALDVRNFAKVALTCRKGKILFAAIETAQD